MAMDFVDFMGRRFYRHTSGYFRFNPTRKQRREGQSSLQFHRVYWEHFRGPIPEGHEIHHRDGDKGNNVISNLECLPLGEHKRLHGPEAGRRSAKWHSTADGTKFHSNNLKKRWKRDRRELLETSVASLTLGREAAKIWHASDKGAAWHAEHSKRIWEKRKQFKKACVVCGKSFLTYWPNRGKFCHANCCAKDFRRRHPSL